MEDPFPWRKSLLKYKWDSAFGREEARKTWNEVDQKPLFFYLGKIVSCNINLSNSEWLLKKLNRPEDLSILGTIEYSSYAGKTKGDAVNSKYVE